MGNGGKSHLVLKVKDTNDASKIAAHAQRMVLYPTMRGSEQASIEQNQQLQHYDKTYHVVGLIRGVRKRHEEYEVLVKWLRSDGGDDETWEALGNIKEDLSGVFQSFLNT